MDITVLQKRMRGLLYEIDDICRSNDIKYMLFAGSQLGIDRHNGMIPWDDDADILMTLDNYDRFIEATRKTLAPDRKVNALENSTDYLFTYARYVDISTTALQKHTIFGGADPGVKVDIFFAVPTHSNFKKAEKHRMEILAFNEVLCSMQVMSFRRPENMYAYYRKEKALYEKLGRDRYVAKRLPELKYKYAGKHRAADKYLLFSGMASNSYIFDAEELNNIKDVTLGEHRVMAAVDGDYFNTMLYGDDWYQVPENVEDPRHKWILDLNRPCSKTLEEVKEKIDTPQVKAVLEARKEAKHIEQREYKNAIILKQKLINLAVALGTEKRYAQNEENHNASFAEIDSLFAPYYKCQLNKQNEWYKNVVPISSNTFIAACENLIRMGEFGKAKAIIRVVEKSTTEEASQIQRNLKSTWVEKIKRAAANLKEIVFDIYGIDNREGRKIWQTNKENPVNEVFAFLEHSEKTPGTIPTILHAEAEGRGKLAEMRNSSDREDRRAKAEDLISFVDKMVPIFGERGELLILKAYGMREIGEDYFTEAEVREVFNKAASNVRNGFVVQELLNKGIEIRNQKNEAPDKNNMVSSILGEIRKEVPGTVVMPGRTMIKTAYDHGSPRTAIMPENDMRIEFLVLPEDFNQIAHTVETWAENKKTEKYVLTRRGKGDKENIIITDNSIIAANMRSIMTNNKKLLGYRLVIRKLLIDSGEDSGCSNSYLTKNVQFLDGWLDVPEDPELFGNYAKKGVDRYSVIDGSVTVEEYMTEAETRGYLSKENRKVFEEYHSWRTSAFKDITKVRRLYLADLKGFAAE